MTSSPVFSPQPRTQNLYPLFHSACMEERDHSKAREEWMRKEEQTHEAVLAMLRKLDERKPAVPALNLSTSSAAQPLKWETIDEFPENESSTTNVRRRIGIDSSGCGVRRNRRMGKFVEHLPSEEEMEQIENDISEETKADWRLSRMGPKVLSYEPAPWEEETTMEEMQTPMEREPSHGLENIIEDEEDSESISTQYVLPADAKSKMLTPPAEYNHPGGYYPVYKLPPDIFPAPPTPRSPNAPVSPVSDFAISRSPTKSPTNLRTRAGLKKIFLSSLRPKKRDDSEPLSPSTTISSSTATTPSLPTPTIRITSPYHTRQFDRSPIGDDHSMMSKLSPIENGYRLPELRLSRADWGEWGRQVAERL